MCQVKLQLTSFFLHIELIHKVFISFLLFKIIIIIIIIIIIRSYKDTGEVWKLFGGLQNKLRKALLFNEENHVRNELTQSVV